MAKIDKKKITHKAISSSKSSKASGSKTILKSTPKVINKGPKKKFDLKKKEISTGSKFDKQQMKSRKDDRKPSQKDIKGVKAPQKGFGYGVKKFEAKKPFASVAPAKPQKKEIRIEQSSKQEYLKKKEMKKIAQEKSHQNRKDSVKESIKDTPKIAKEAAKSAATKAELVTKGKAAAPTEVVKAKKTEVKAPAAGKKGAKKKVEENDLDDVFIDDVENSEIDEYEDELKAVEELDNETDDDILLESDGRERKFEDIELTDAEGNKLCRSRDCDQIATVDGYCRYHYLLFWKNIQLRKKILTDGKLGRYVEELTSRYPDKFLEMIRRDLRTQKDFLAAIQELEIDETAVDNDFEDDAQNFIDEVRGVNETTSLEDDFE